MASSKKTVPNNAQDSVKAVQDKAEQLKSSLEKGSVTGVFAQEGVTKGKSAAATGPAGAIPNPSAPLDKSVLENIGIVGNKGLGNNAVHSTAASITSLSDAKKAAFKADILPQSVQEESVQAGIKVDPDYKPAYQSKEASVLSGGMAGKAGDPAVGSTPSLQSRLGNDQNNLYRPSASGGADNNTSKLGGGFRMANDPNISTPPPGSPYSGVDNNNGYGQPSQNNSGMHVQPVHHHEEVKGKGGMSAGAIGMIGGLLVAGGVGAVVMKPDLLSTTGTSNSSSGMVQTVSVPAPTTLIPDSFGQGAAAPQNQRVAAVNVMPAPAKPSSLKVGDSSVQTGKDVPLQISAMNLKPKDDQYIRVGGVPGHTTLSEGLDMGDGIWLLAPNALEGLKLTTEDGFKGTLNLYTQLIKNDAKTPIGTPKTFNVYIGQAASRPVVAAAPRQPQQQARVASYTPAPVQPQPQARPQVAPEPLRAVRTVPKLPTGLPENNDGEDFGALPTAGGNKYERPSARKRSVAPARAPRQLREAIPVGRMFSKSNYGKTAEPIRQERVASATPQRTVPQISEQRARGLLKRGNNLYRLGDLVSARALYGQVAAGGNPEAAMAMGRTYDPIYFEKLGVQGFQPEPSRAIEWYEKARSAGLAKAQQKIDNLKYFLRQ